MLLLASSEEEFDSILQNYMKKINDMGYEQLIDECTKVMQESKRKLGLD
ncbi:MAG: putative secreted protein [Herbinix sp.]|nr:putative secreted protein [Herbinix sp.]